MTAHGTKRASADGMALELACWSPGSPPPRARTSRSALGKALNGLHEIADGAHRAEILRRHFAADDSPHAFDEIHRIDAVDLEILPQPGIERHARGIDLEQLGE